MTTIPKSFGQGSFSDDIKNKFGTIYTPEFIVEQTVDLAIKYYQGDLLQSTFCDPAAGDGNFLEYLYKRLIQEPSDMPDIQKSHHILTNCLYGVEIIDSMALLAKVRLSLLHKEHTGDTTLITDIFHNLNIYHGNALLSPLDVELGLGHPERFAGGLLPEEIRNKKFDLIVCNPPYTSYGIGTRRSIQKPTNYTDTKTLAESFTKWAYSHVADRGVVSLNISSMLLNSNNSIRKAIAEHILEVVYDQGTKEYSTYEGGDMPTVIFAFRKNKRDQLIVNGQPSQLDIQQMRFLQMVDYVQPDYVSQPIINYNVLYNKIISSTGNRQADQLWKEMLICKGDGEDLFIGFPIHLYLSKHKPIDHNHFKLFECSKKELVDLGKQYRVGQGGSGIKWFWPKTRELALFLWCFLNSTRHLNVEMRQWGKSKRAERGGRMYQLNAADFSLCHVPDIEYYKHEKPAEFAAIIQFAEEHLLSEDMDNYCLHVDTLINNLLGY